MILFFGLRLLYHVLIYGNQATYGNYQYENYGNDGRAASTGQTNHTPEGQGNDYYAEHGSELVEHFGYFDFLFISRWHCPFPFSELMRRIRGGVQAQQATASRKTASHTK